MFGTCVFGIASVDSRLVDERGVLFLSAHGIL